jgi:GNAT superfamily N-acetyltransferase
MTIPLQSTPIGQILTHENAYWSTVADMQPRDGYCLFCNPRLAPRVDPNHAGAFRAPTGQARRIVAEIVDFYSQQGIHPAAYVDQMAPPDLVPALHAAGFVEWSGADVDLMIYIGPDEGRTARYPVEIVASQGARAEWAGIHEADADRELMMELYTTAISDTRMTAYLIRIDGEPAARCQLFSADGLGRVEAVRTREGYRGRGLAAALIRRATLDSLTQGNRMTYLFVEPGSAPERLYYHLGYRTVARNLMRGFIKAS